MYQDLTSRPITEAGLHMLAALVYTNQNVYKSRTPYAGEPLPDLPWLTATASAGGVCRRPFRLALGGFLEALGRILKALGRVLEVLEGVLEASWLLLEAFWRLWAASRRSC